VTEMHSRRPLLQINLKFEVYEPVSQGCRHPGRDGPVGIAVSGSNDGPSVGQRVFAKLAIQDKLVAAGLDHRRRRVQFIQEQNP
jgi:hypothetical protein